MSAQAPAGVAVLVDWLEDAHPYLEARHDVAGDRLELTYAGEPDGIRTALRSASSASLEEFRATVRRLLSA